MEQSKFARSPNQFSGSTHRKREMFTVKLRKEKKAKLLNEKRKKLFGLEFQQK